jgi:16S rRNA processing protein RimM
VTNKKQLCVGKILGAHGLRGLVRLRSYTEIPEAIATYPLTTADGRRIKLALKSKAGEEYVAAIEGCDSKEQADALRGHELLTDRSALPQPTAKEYYHADLIGLPTRDLAGKVLGSVAALHDFGAGGMLEIQPVEGKQSFMLPFRDAFVPVIDLEQGFVVIDPPADWLKPKTEKPKAKTKS